MNLFKRYPLLPYTLVATLLLISPIEPSRQLKWHPDTWGETKTLASIGENIYQGFDMPYDAVLDKEYECFLRAVYVESYSEGIKGQQAVAQVLVNRSLSREFPESMCDIVSQRVGRVYQFPWMREKNKRELSLDKEIIDEMTIYLASIYAGGYTVPKLEKASYFKRCDVKGDSWWSSLRMVAKIGDHCFYSKRGE